MVEFFDAVPPEKHEADLALKVAKNEIVIRPEDFGTIGDGAADDTVALQKAFDYAASRTQPCILWINGRHRVTASIYWDVARVSVIGAGQISSCTRSGAGGLTITDAMNSNTKYLVRAYSSEAGEVAGSPVKQRGTFWEGVKLDGDGVTNNLYLGSPDANTNQWASSYLQFPGGKIPTGKVAHVNFRSFVSVRGGIGVHFRTNAYMINFVQSTISLNRVGVQQDSNINNSGERLEFFGCDLTGNGTTAKLTSGQCFFFHGCSFSYVTRQVFNITEGMIITDSCHFEHTFPHAPLVEITSRGTWQDHGSIRLLKDGGPVSLPITFPAGSTTATWADNARERYGVGDSFRFTTVTGADGVNNTTTYYMTAVSNTGFSFSATKGGAPIAWTTAGTAPGVTLVGESPFVSVADTFGHALITGGKIHGDTITSASKFDAFADGLGTAIIERTTAPQGTGLLIHSTKFGDLRDPLLTNAGWLDDWRVVGNLAAISRSTDVVTGTNSILATRISGTTTTTQLQLYMPINRNRMLIDFNYKKTSAATVSAAAQYLPKIDAPTSTNLFSSNLAAASGVWTKWVQNGLYWKYPPPWAHYLFFRVDLSPLAVGETFQIDTPRFSAL